MNFIAKHKKFIACIVILVVIAAVIKQYFFSRTEFVLLSHMTKIDSKKNSINEIILVKNVPEHPSDLKKLIDEYAAARTPGYANVNQLFIKEHDYIFFPALTLDENYSYENPDTPGSKLDNADFLAKRVKYTGINGNVVDTAYCFTGKYNFYKE